MLAGFRAFFVGQYETHPFALYHVPSQKKARNSARGMSEASVQDIMSDDRPETGCSTETYVLRLYQNLVEINLMLKPYNLDSLGAYLDLTGGTPVEPLELPPKYMDRVTWLWITATLNDAVQAARESQKQDNGRALNQALKNRWNHVFFTRPMDADKFRSQLGALLDERFSLMRQAKSVESYNIVDWKIL